LPRNDRRAEFTSIFLLDGALVYAAWMGAYGLRFHALGLSAPLGVPRLSTYLELGVLLVPLVLLSLHFVGAYRRDRLQTGMAEAAAVMRGVLLAALLAALASYFTRGEVARSVLVLFACLAVSALCASRAAVRALFRAIRRRGRSVLRVLVVGTGVPAEALISRIGRRGDLAHSLVGCVAEAPGRTPAAPFALPVLGTVGELPGLAERAGAEIVFVALTREEHELEREAVHRLWDSTADIRVVADLGGPLALGARVQDFDGLPIVHVTAVPGGGWNAAAKRALDLVAAAAALVVLSPLFAVLYLWIRFDSPGPAFYAQERVGLNGRRFRMLKFRTMRADAEARSGPTWARAEDPRCTRAGRFLRRLSLDELPQLWNVICGAMSLVGPRPERPIFVERFREIVPGYMLRHHMRAGMTGWAQVHGLRGDTPLERRIEYDLYYIRNWSLALDLRIVSMTLAGVLRETIRR